MRYAIALGQGGWVVRNGITGRCVIQAATSEEAQQSEDAWDEKRRFEWGYVARFASGADQKSVRSL